MGINKDTFFPLLLNERVTAKWEHMVQYTNTKLNNEEHKVKSQRGNKRSYSMFPPNLSVFDHNEKLSVVAQSNVLEEILGMNLMNKVSDRKKS